MDPAGAMAQPSWRGVVTAVRPATRQFAVPSAMGRLRGLARGNSMHAQRLGGLSCRHRSCAKVHGRQCTIHVPAAICACVICIVALHQAADMGPRGCTASKGLAACQRHNAQP